MSETNEYKDDNMTVFVSEEPGCVVKLDITVTPEAVKAAYLKAIKSVNKEVSIPGFRKGRAPDNMVISHYKKYVDEEWRDLVLNIAFNDAIKLTNKFPYNKNATKQPQIKTLSKEEGARFSIEFETAPIVPQLDVSGFTIPAIEKKPVTEADINDFVEQMRLRTATWEDIEGRGVHDGDYVDLDIESLDEPGVMLCENTRFEVSKKMAKWMHKLLIGTTQGSTVEGLSAKDHEEHTCSSDCGTEGHEHHHHKHDDFKPTNCRITVKAIKKPILPELDEEFAKKVSSDSIEKLHENARKKLENDAEAERNDKIKDSLKKQIEENYQFEIPRSFVSSNDQDELAQMRLFFIVNEFAKQHQVAVSNNDVYQAAMHEVMTRGELADDLLNGDERRVDSARTILYTNMLIEKSLNKLLQLATEKVS